MKNLESELGNQKIQLLSIDIIIYMLSVARAQGFAFVFIGLGTS